MKRRNIYLLENQLVNEPFTVKTTVGHEKAVQAIDVHKTYTNCAVTLWVTSQFLHLQGVVQAFVPNSLSIFPKIVAR